jgi:hypothetical protein
MITTRFFYSGIYIILHSMNIGKQNHIFIITITSQIYLSIYLYDHIISLRGEVWAHKTSLTLPLWSVCTKLGQWVVMYLCVKGIDFFLCFYNFWGNILELFWQCGILELFWQCGIFELFWQCGILELFWQCGILELFWQCGILELFWQCSILVLFWQCGILVLFW